MNSKLKTEQFHQILVKNKNNFKKDYKEKFLENTIKFLGIDIPDLEQLVKTWYTKNRFSEIPVSDKLELVENMVKGSYYENKIGGGLLILFYILEAKNFKKILDLIESFYDQNLIYDWDTGDWFASRLLTPMIESKDQSLITRICSWKNSEYLWKARASAISLVNINKLNEYSTEIKEISLTLIKRIDRHAKTAAAWLLREFSKDNKEYVTGFVKTNLNYFTKETILAALNYYPEEQNKYFM